VRNSETGRRVRGTVRVRLHGVAAVAALFIALVGGVGLSGYAGLNAANTAENRLGTLQALALEAQSQQRTIRAQAWFAIAVGAGEADRPMSEVRAEFDAARARLNAVHDNLAGTVAGTDYAPRFQKLVVSEDEIVALADEAIALAAADRRRSRASIGWRTRRTRWTPRSLG
jgi:hypothetical protein